MKRKAHPNFLNSRRNTGKPSWNKGKNFPHTPEWEKKRLQACRIAGLMRRGIPTGRPPTEKVNQALRQWKIDNPEKARLTAIANLPKNCVGSNNGNWKGGITSKTRGFRFSVEYQRWRKFVLKRDGHKCKLCSSNSALQVHHIIPISECPRIATLPMNGVVLCKKCHYENDEAWRGKRFDPPQSKGRTLALIFSIPHSFQVYPTVGNWAIFPTGEIVIFVSDTGNEWCNALIAVHELWEVLLCQKRGISQESVDQFDIAFEKMRESGNTEEPGDNPNAPYHREHCSATGVERILCSELDIPWKVYEEAVNKL